MLKICYINLFPYLNGRISSLNKGVQLQQEAGRVRKQTNDNNTTPCFSSGGGARGCSKDTITTQRASLSEIGTDGGRKQMNMQRLRCDEGLVGYTHTHTHTQLSTTLFIASCPELTLVAQCFCFFWLFARRTCLVPKGPRFCQIHLSLF